MPSLARSIVLWERHSERRGQLSAEREGGLLCRSDQNPGEQKDLTQRPAWRAQAQTQNPACRRSRAIRAKDRSSYAEQLTADAENFRICSGTSTNQQITIYSSSVRERGRKKLRLPSFKARKLTPPAAVLLPCCCILGGLSSEPA
eukprot:scaffold4052_cov226-Pinguiococcus_pyrenoidosus.AAC.2